MADVFFRAFVGPKWQPTTSAQFFDWSAYDLGAADTLDFATALTATLSSGATSASVSSAAAFASSGGLWIGPNGTGQAWEYIEYGSKTSTSFAGLVRESTTYREHNGIHTSGAAVRQWMPVDTNNGRLRIVRELNDELCATSWYAELAGVRFPQRCMRNDHVIVIQQAATPGGAWTNMLVGFLDAPAVADAWEKRGEWRVRIGSIASVMGATQAPGVRVGEWDIAREGTATSSPIIPGAHKEFETSGFDHTLRSFEAGNAIDGRTDTLWIADEMIGTPNEPGAYEGVTQMYINPTPSLGRKGFRWLQIEGADYTSAQLHVYDPIKDEGYFVTPGVNVESGEILIICENEALFMRENPCAAPDHVYDLSTTDTPDFFEWCQPSGGGIMKLAGGVITNVLLWGTQTAPPSLWDGGSFTGDPAPAPGIDQTMRRLHSASGTEGEKWEVSRRQAPGHHIENNDDEVWIQVSLPAMELRLGAAIDSDDTTIGLVWGDTPSTNGLPSSGSMLIDDEWVSYTAKSNGNVTGCTRGAHGSTAAAHAKDGKVYVRHDINGDADYAAVDGYPIKTTAWANDAGGVSTIERTLLWSSGPDKRTPDDSLHERDYPKTDFQNDTVASDSITHSPAIRPRTVMMQFETLATDPARPRLSRLECWVDPAFWDSASWVWVGTVEDTLTTLAAHAGVPEGALTTTAGGYETDGHATAADAVWPVMVDLADFGNGYIAIALDSKLTHRPNWIWSTAVGSYTPSYTWAAVDVARVEKVWQRGASVGQIKLNWATVAGEEQDPVTYPATADPTGRVEEIGPFLYPNSTAATLAARKRYFLSKYPYTALVQLAEGNLSVNPGAVASLAWQFDEEMQPIDRLYLTKSVEHLIEGGAVVTTINLIEIDREAP